VSSGYLLGPLGSMVDISNASDLSGGSDVSPDRPSNPFTAISGARPIVQVAQFAARSWAFKASLLTPAAVRTLLAAAQPQLGLDLWLLDEAAARANCLWPHQAVGAQTSTVTVDGWPLPSFHTSSGAGTDIVYTVPVLGSQTYTLSIWTMATTGTVATYSGPGVTGSLTGAAGSPARRAGTFVPSSSGTLTITIKGNLTALSSGLRLAHGSDDGVPWIAGQGTPCRVYVGDPSRALRMLPASSHALADWALTLLEVGVPGVM